MVKLNSMSYQVFEKNERTQVVNIKFRLTVLASEQKDYPNKALNYIC